MCVYVCVRSGYVYACLWTILNSSSIVLNIVEKYTRNVMRVRLVQLNRGGGRKIWFFQLHIESSDLLRFCEKSTPLCRQDVLISYFSPVDPRWFRLLNHFYLYVHFLCWFWNVIKNKISVKLFSIQKILFKSLHIKTQSSVDSVTRNECHISHFFGKNSVFWNTIAHCDKAMDAIELMYVTFVSQLSVHAERRR